MEDWGLWGEGLFEGVVLKKKEERVDWGGGWVIWGVWRVGRRCKLGGIKMVGGGGSRVEGGGWGEGVVGTGGWVSSGL